MMFYTCCLFKCESLLCKLQWKAEYRSVYGIHVRASEQPCFRSQVLGSRDGLLHFSVWSLVLWVPWVSPEPSCGSCTIITSIDDTDIAQPHLPFIEMRKTTKAAVAHSVNNQCSLMHQPKERSQSNCRKGLFLQRALKNL